MFVVHWLCAVTVRGVAGLSGSRPERTVVQRATQYAKSGRVGIAYQVVGDGPTDLIVVPGFVSHVELAWEEPLLAHFLVRLASFSRAHRTMRGTDQHWRGRASPGPARTPSVMLIWCSVTRLRPLAQLRRPSNRFRRI